MMMSINIKHFIYCMHNKSAKYIWMIGVNYKTFKVMQILNLFVPVC